MSIHLCGYICDRCACHATHTVNPSISRSCSLRLSIDGARRCKYMFECLGCWNSRYIYSWRRIQILLTFTRISPWRRPFQGSESSYWWSRYRNIGHRSPGIDSSPVRNFCLILIIVCVNQCIWQKMASDTHSWSDQSIPVGQSNFPVISWLNPRTCLSFRPIGGETISPAGTSQSTIADLRLFVSSERALDAPFCNWQLEKRPTFELLLEAVKKKSSPKLRCYKFRLLIQLS